jgi:hypothetical protein
MKIKTLLFSAALGLAASSVLASPVKGDIAVIMANADAPDSFAWVALKTIDASTTINFTDSSYGNDSGSGFEAFHRFTEHLDAGGGGPLAWSHTSSLAAGTVITWDGTAWSTGSSSGSATIFSASGDQIFAYTGAITDAGGVSSYRGDSSAATYLAGINWANSAGWISSGAGSTSNSYLPAPLATGAQNLHAGNQDNARYNGPTSGTASELLTAINDPSNWQTDDAAAYTWDSGNFNVIPEPGAATLFLLGIGLLLRLRKRNS